MPSVPNTNFNEHQWILHIRRSIEDDFEHGTEIPVSIFNAPKPLMSTDPDSYTPQQVAIGPYHCWRPDLYEMERHKLAAAKRTQKRLGSDLKFQHIVDQVMKFEPRIRACYHKSLDMSHQTLAWMMAIDASFLLDFLQGTKVASRKSARDAILRDVVMLENQMPLFVLRKVLECQFELLELSDEMLEAMVLGLCKDISPLKMVQLEKKKVHVSDAAHLLDYLYETMVSKTEAQQPEIAEAEDQGSENGIDDSAAGNTSHLKDLFNKIHEVLQKLQKSRAFKFVINLPWKILSKLPVFSVITQPVEFLLMSEDNKHEIKPKSDDFNADKPPLVEEIAIPCVSELSKSGVHFIPTLGNVKSVSFDPKTVTLYLPVLNLDDNTEVVLRNLVAYEASNASGPLVFTRYTELMNGIIDTDEDVKLLREKGIIMNRMKSDKAVADVWNGMSKSVRLTKVRFLDKVIEDVNKHYDGRWKVKVGNFMKKYVFGSWQFLTLLAAIMLLILMMLQAFCLVCDCAGIFRVSTS